MKTINYIEMENGAIYKSDAGNRQMDIIEEIDKIEFLERFPDVSIYGLEQYSPVYLETGIVCINTEWNGENYDIKTEDTEISIYPVYEEIEEDDVEIIGYIER